MAFTIICANPLEHAAALKELFCSNDSPWFPEFFDRAYPSAARRGAKSWIGLEADGRAVLHIARFRHRFRLREHTVVAGQLANLMVAKSHRTFLPAVSLMRRVVADSKADGDTDFLYGDPLPPAAGVLKAAGFSIVGTVGRFAFPLAGRRWYTDAITRLYRALLRIRGWSRSVKVVEHGSGQFDAEIFERPAGTAAVLRPFRPIDLFRQRLASYPSGADRWFTFHQDGRDGRPSGAVLVREVADRVVKIISLSRDPSLPLSSVVPPLTAELRSAGYERLWASAMLDSNLAHELTRAGFFYRHDSFPVLGCALTQLGEDAVRSVAVSEIADLDCDRGEAIAG